MYAFTLAVMLRHILGTCPSSIVSRLHVVSEYNLTYEDMETGHVS